MIKAIITASALALAALSSAAFAHGSTKPRHGGVTQVSGEMVIELVRSAKGVDVYVVEEDEPVAATGLDGKLTITAGGAKQAVVLAPGEGNLLSAPGLAVPAGAKVVVALTGKADGAKAFATFDVK
ncbi:hypothetical protein [Novosphingobium jiangmenense]|uniref:Uncharacterized protein n=1 Tax=Novosphingobium jiangmenense TaxID=2791981 RepID=A0ABS0HFT0_9SPHN|nr:hypothetical protein [Novosphingobium jiangmenense]MBF9151132.1 hypothetical protein [Novosphingobium jiangmenense]